MLSIQEFIQRYPQFGIDFSSPIAQQARIYDNAILAELPEELRPSHQYRSGGRGRPNLNQTLTHGQCKACKRVLRNDFFYAPPSIMRRNGIFTNCLACSKNNNVSRYRTHSSAMRSRRVAIWQYLAPCCAVCGFDKHISAMDMHHTGAKESEIATLITEVTFVPNSHKIEKLLREAAQCVALCANCHRMYHADALTLDVASLQPLPYKLLELANILDEIEVDTDEQA